MQVSQIAEMDTHAVIGGGQARAFGMADTAEFFTILSDTLYRDKVRAVAREVICNAWDAHIISNKEDVPVEITLSDTELTIKDVGPGISDERIVPIYCVFGNSTKAKDETQTGGFGLGSKAPFAYSDHFSVSSCHDGSRIVYAISRGGIETEGKPDIRAMVKVPTTETGITVTIPIRTAGDSHAFKEAIRAVVFQGGIRARLNGADLPRIDYTGARKIGFTLISNVDRSLSESMVYALYGTVLYPVSSADSDIQRAVNKLDGMVDNYDRRLILVCPPNSIGVTPSRESISYTERTKQTILDLLGNVFKVLKREVRPAARQVVRERASKMKRNDISLNRIGQNSNWDHTVSATDDLKVVARAVAATRLSNFLERRVWQKDAMIQFSKNFREERRFFRRHARFAAGGNLEHYINRQTHRHAMRLILRLAKQTGHLDKLFTYHRNSYGQDTLIPITKRREYIADDFQLIIAPNQREGMAAAKVAAKDEYWNHRGSRTIVLVLGRRNKDQIPELEAKAKQFKITHTVLDFGSVPKPKVKRTYSLYALDQVNASQHLVGDPTVNTAPIFVEVSGGARELEVPALGSYDREILCKHYGTIALARTQIQKRKLEEQGSVIVYEKILADLKAAMARDDVLFTFLVQYGTLVGGWTRTLGSKARSLAKAHPALADYLFAPGIKRGADLDRISELMRIAFCRNFPRAFNGNAVDLKNEFTQAAEQRFKSVIVPESASEKKFAHLRFIASDASLSDADAAEVIRILKFLELPAVPAPHPKLPAPKPATPKVATKSLKEAA